jgi:hypothetical protein
MDAKIALEHTFSSHARRRLAYKILMISMSFISQLD